MQYLYLTPSVVFPCDISDLRYALQQSLGRHPERYLETWPGHGHGPEWHMQVENTKSVIVLDLSNNGAILSVEELKKLGVWPNTVQILANGTYCSLKCPFYAQGFGHANCDLNGKETSLHAMNNGWLRTPACLQEMTGIAFLEGSYEDM